MNPQSPPLRKTFPLVFYPPGWRWPAGGLFVLSRVSLVVVALMLASGWFMSPPLLFRLVVLLALIPGLLTILLRKVFAAECETADGQLTIRRTGLYRRHTEESFKLAQVDSWSIWSLPSPGPGVSIRVQGPSVTRHLALETKRPNELIAVLTDCCTTRISAVQEATRTYGERKAGSRAARWHSPFVKFGLFGLLPFLVVFRLHQNIMYGGLFGQYHLFGPAPWLESLAYHWIIVTIYLVLYAAFWRAWVEAGCWLSARYMPSRAGVVRAWGEGLALTVYFAGIPAFIVWRSFV